MNDVGTAYAWSTAGVQCNLVPCKLAGIERILADQIAAVNDQTLQQLCDWLQTEHGVRVAVSTLWKTLARMGISLKKDTPCHRAANLPRDSAGAPGLASRAMWTGDGAVGISGRDLGHHRHDPGSRSFTRRHALYRACPSSSLENDDPDLRIALRRPDCAVGHRWPGQRGSVADLGPTSTGPVLRPGDIVVMDNLGSHKVAGIVEAVQVAGAQVRYLPPYSPDYNPIEQVFAKLKAQLRKAAKCTVDELWSTIGYLLDQFPVDECARYIRHVGYGKSA